MIKQQNFNQTCLVMIVISKTTVALITEVSMNGSLKKKDFLKINNFQYQQIIKKGFFRVNFDIKREFLESILI